MFPLFALLFIVVPIIDFTLLFKIGSYLTFWPTLGLCLATGIGGAALARWQGFNTLARIQQSLSQGQMPAGALGEGALILVAAALLMTPGFITDAIGFSLLIPPIRRLYLTLLTRYFRSRIHVRTVGFGGFSGDESNTYGQTSVQGHAFDDAPFADQQRSGPKYVRNEAMDRERTVEAEKD